MPKFNVVSTLILTSLLFYYTSAQGQSLCCERKISDINALRYYLDTDAIEEGLPIIDEPRLVHCGELGHPLFANMYLLDNGRKCHIIYPKGIQKKTFNTYEVTNISCPQYLWIDKNLLFPVECYP